MILHTASSYLSFESYSFETDFGKMVSVPQWLGRPGFNPKLSYTKD